MRAEIELSDAAGAREAVVGALYRLQGAGERLALRRESLGGLAARLQEDLGEAERRPARTDERCARSRRRRRRGGGRA